MQESCEKTIPPKMFQHTIQDFNVKIQVGIAVMTLCMLSVHIKLSQRRRMVVLYNSIT